MTDEELIELLDKVLHNPNSEFRKMLLEDLENKEVERK
jgi:hypothetical protein